MIQVVPLGEVSNAQAAEWLVDLSEELRQSDLDEIKASTGEDPATAVVASVMVSDHAWMVLDDEDPIAVFGCAPTDDPSAALVWMVGSDRMDEPENALGILRLSRRYKDAMHRTYPVLYNWIDARNEKSLKWLDWCGYEILDADHEYGVERRLFYLFAKRKPHV